jgi:hypothetical protein
VGAVLLGLDHLGVRGAAARRARTALTHERLMAAAAAGARAAQDDSGGR